MRVKKEIQKLNYADIKSFFKKRADRFNDKNPYSVTMYQDNNLNLVLERNNQEIERLMPYLRISDQSVVLDVGCGIGRWADSLPECVKKYTGIDFSDELIDIARERNKKKNFSFHTGGVCDIEKTVMQSENKKVNTVLMIGILVYINDADIVDALSQIIKVCDEHCIICVREPIAVEERLTLKDFFSDELQDNYNAIYRSDMELMNYFETTFMKNGFALKKKDFLFDNALNNRKETVQYYYIFER